MSLSDKTKKNINETIQKKLGMSYEEFSLLDFDTQQELLKKCKSKKKNKYETVMIGSGELSIFTKLKHGERYMLSDGTFTRAGITVEEENLVKKISKKIKNR